MTTTPNRVRSIYMDFDRDGRFPQRGDRILTNGGMLYWVLRSHRVKRKVPDSRPRVSLTVVTQDDIEKSLKHRLLISAMRRDASLLFTLQWYPRTKKTQTFERYMRRS